MRLTEVIETTELGHHEPSGKVRLGIVPAVEIAGGAARCPPLQVRACVS